MYHFANMRLLITLTFACQWLGTNGGDGRLTFDVTNCGPDACDFNQIAVDQTRNGYLYVGGTNKLYQVNDDLTLAKSVVTGPSSDGVSAINKILLIDKVNNRIVVCNSNNHGLCELRKEGDIKKVLTKFNVNATTAKQYVAASSDLSTVGFLASANNQQYLFVGSSKTSTDESDTAFTVSQRKLYEDNSHINMFSVQLFQDEIYVGDMALSMMKELPQAFRVNFIDGFELDNTGYFVLQHPPATNSHQVNSYIAQVCTGYPSSLLRTYRELQVECSVNGRRYTKAIASITRNVGSELATVLNIPQSDAVMFISFEGPSSQDGGAVCLYPLHDIDQQFVSMLSRCMKHQRNPPKKISWVQNEDVSCGQGTFVVQSPACSNGDIWDIAQFLKDGPLVKSAVYVSDRLITAIEVTTTQEHTIAFLGSSIGVVTKLRLNSNQRHDVANAYESVVVDSKIPIQSIQLAYRDPGSPKTPVIYVMTSRNLVALPLYSCNKHKDCSSCLGSGDPFCGWCPLETRCVSTSQCGSAIKLEQNCPSLTSSNGDLKMSIQNSQKEVTLLANNIPHDHSSSYECRFNDQTSAYTRVTNNPDGSITVRCVTPTKSSVPPLRTSGSRQVPLSLVYQGRTLASTNFTYYNCTYHSQCMSCVESGFNCEWCIYESRCVESKTQCNQISETADQSTNCPQVSTFSEGRPTYYLAQGQRSTLKLRGAELPTGSSRAKYQCLINVPNAKQWLVDAQRLSSNQVHCKGVEGFVPQGRRSSNATVTVMWNKTTIDSTQQLTVVMFKCTLDTDNNCGTCLQSSVEWQCGWCETISSCTHVTDVCDRDSWLKAQADQVCRNPHIDSFSPTTTNPGSKTLVTLTGTNFDSNGNMKITVAGYNCTLVLSNCCEASCSLEGSEFGSGNISLCITDRHGRCRDASYYHTATTEHFRFVQSQLDFLSPANVLCGWGTPITINGSNLDAGNSVNVQIGNQDCAISRRTGSTIECRLPCGVKCTSNGRRRRHSRRHAHRRRHRRHSKRRKRSAPNAWFSFDGARKVPARNSAVRFRTTVRIDRMQPLRTFYSGGIPLRVTGTNLHLIHDPRIRVEWEDASYTSICIPIGRSDTLECISPHVNDRRFHSSKSGDIPDDVFIESPKCQRTRLSGDQLIYVHDPVLEQFETPEQTKTFRNEPIYINGANLCPEVNGCNIDIVSVTVGEEKCNVSRYDMGQIECQPPAVSSGIYPVMVQIGGYEGKVGSLKYEEPFNNVPVIMGISAVVLVVFLAVVGFGVCRYRRRMHARDQEVKNMQVQMSVMESKVAKVCKEAFAELQTDMSELDNVGGGVGIPYLHYSEYLLRVLFPDAMLAGHQNLLLPRHHLERSDSRTSNRPMLRGSPLMDQFNQLLENKCFMLCFIRAIERQNTFTMKDKANVAGLILVILQNRLVYATEILEQLLSELVDRNMENNQHPKLLFRRTESVAEKMLTHWFSILLHRFVVECAGEPLFMLYRAIKQQVDKGPVDMFTSEARYSLSEDKLLRQSVEHDVIILRVVNYMSDHDQFEFSVKVLSCDSVSQAKRKILDVAYMHVHYSQRPQPEYVDLEWKRQGPQGSLTLKDEDTTNEITDDGKLVNTLGHYMVPAEGALIAVVPRQGSSVLNYSAMSTNSKSGHRHNGSGSRLFQMEGSNTSLPRYKQTSRSGTPTLPPEGKLYHLVKQNDQDQREGNDHGNKMVSEIYLTRLLTTKGTIQKFVDDLFETIFSVTQRGHALPLAVKHMFDFLDHQADIHDIVDPDIVHTWKSNCLPLRFWVNMIKNPEFVFDIHKSAIVDCYLSVIAQAFMDSCSTAVYKYGKDSPSNKLLYAKDIPNYRHWVTSYYRDISEMPRLNPKNMAAFLNEESLAHSYDFNTNAALQQLFSYMQKYHDKIADALDNEPEARRQNLLQRMEQMCMPSNGGS